MVQNEENLNTKGQEETSKAEQMAKDVGKKAAKETGKLAKTALKKAVLAIIKVFGMKFFIIAIAILLIIVILVASIYVLKVDAGKRKDNNNRKCTICCI